MGNLKASNLSKENAVNRPELIEHLLTELRAMGYYTRQPNLSDRDQLKAILTTLPPGQTLPEDFTGLMDQLLQAEQLQVPLTDAHTLPLIADTFPGSNYPAKNSCAIWKGDITTLSADAIVNAANAQLLGCFVPFHRCIDNAIHSAAGPELREACFALMQAQGHPEMMGMAKVTPGFNLPAGYVLHTVGPIIPDGKPTAMQQQELACCYRSCLDLAKENGKIKTIVFCCISTGVFGYPAEAAALIALQTVSKWLKDNPQTIERAVFNVFSDQDQQIYESLIKAWN